jgi:hypothetical protein
MSNQEHATGVSVIERLKRQCRRLLGQGPAVARPAGPPTDQDEEAARIGHQQILEGKYREFKSIADMRRHFNDDAP